MNPKLRHLRVIHIEQTVDTVWNRKGQTETSVPDVSRFTRPARALFHDKLEGFLQLFIPPCRVEPLLEQLQGTVSPNMTTRIMALLEQSRDTVTRHDYLVLM